MQALYRRLPEVHFELFTDVPEWFFEISLQGSYSYNRFASDVGLTQLNPFDADLPETVRRLEKIFTERNQWLSSATNTLKARRCCLVLCDIAFTGIEVAEALGIPSILIENFTWDFIYAGYSNLEPGLDLYAREIDSICARATYHIQTRPICEPNPGCIHVEPVSRPPITSSIEIRSRLGVGLDELLILVTTGGISPVFQPGESLKRYPDITFLLPGSGEVPSRDVNLVRLPHQTGFYSPDLIAASDAVIGKLGYSTVAEVFHAGVPFGFIRRPDFPETATMENFVQTEIPALELPLETFLGDDWGNLPRSLLDLPRSKSRAVNGADQIADFVKGMVLR